MNLMFWQKKDMTDVSEDDSQDMPDDRIAPQKSVEPNARHDETSEGTDEEPENDRATKFKLLLIMGTVAGIVILSAVGFAAWKFFLSSPPQKIASTVIPTAPPPAPFSANGLIKLPPIGFRQPRKVQPAPHTTGMAAPVKNASAPPVVESKIESPPAAQPQVASNPANIDTPAKIDSKPQAQTVVQKIQPQPSTLPHTTTQNHVPLSTHNGDLVVGGKDPQSSAMALKKMIEIMNTDSDTTPKNVAK